MKTISIIMGIYNCESTLGDAIQSILDQSYPHWHLIMCDDGSRDGTYQVAHSYQQRFPDKILLLKNDTNLGLNATLNKCLSHAKGDYIARQDGDDVSLPSRFEKEVQHLEQHPECAIVSTGMILFDEKGDWGSVAFPPVPQKKDLMRGTIFSHAACMVRREAYEAVGGYSVSPKLLRVEDFHLWYKMYLKGYQGYNLKENLYRARDDRDAQGRRSLKNRINECRVRWLVFKNLKPGIHTFPHIIRPLLVAMLPGKVYQVLHRRRLKK